MLASWLSRLAVSGVAASQLTADSKAKQSSKGRQVVGTQDAGIAGSRAEGCVCAGTNALVPVPVPGAQRPSDPANGVRHTAQWCGGNAPSTKAPSTKH